MWRIRRSMQVALGLAVFAAVADGGTARAQTLLRWKFQPGATFRYVLTQQMEQTIQGGSKGPVTLTTTMSGDTLWKVESVDKDGAGTVSQTMEGMRIKVQGPQGVVVDYDSASGKEPEGAAKMVAPVFEAMIQNASIVKFDAQGKALEVKPPQGLLESVGKLAGGKPMGDMFSPESMKQFYDSVVLAEQPVKKGDTWSRQVDMKLPFVGVLAVEYKYEYLGRESRRGKALEKLVLTMAMKSQKDKPATKDKEDAKDNKTPVFTFKDWTAHGELYFDNAAGRLVESEMKTRMKAEIAVMGKQATMDLKGTVRMDLQPGKAAKKPPKP